VLQGVDRALRCGREGVSAVEAPLGVSAELNHQVWSVCRPAFRRPRNALRRALEPPLKLLVALAVEGCHTVHQGRVSERAAQSDNYVVV